jgi:hypothetical protein
VFKVLLGSLDRRDFKAFKVLLVHKAFKALLVSLAHKDYKGLRAFREQRDL